jgi:hypothetical protein
LLFARMISLPFLTNCCMVGILALFFVRVMRFPEN